MTEQVLVNFLEGSINSSELALDLKDSQIVTEATSSHVLVNQLQKGSFEIEPEHLIMLCNEVSSDRLQLLDLNTIAFVLNFSDYFLWDSETQRGLRVSETLFAWDNPEIDFDLSHENIPKWKHFLKTGEKLFDRKELIGK